MPAAAGAIAAWVLYISAVCGPYEPLTILPTEADCQALALTAWQWDIPGWGFVVACAPADVPPPAADAERCAGP